MKNIFETEKIYFNFGKGKVEINNFAAADADDSVRIAITRNPFTRLRSAWRDKSRKYLLDNGVVNVELFRKWGREGDSFSVLFEKGKNPYSEEAIGKLWLHAKKCDEYFGQYSKKRIRTVKLLLTD